MKTINYILSLAIATIIFSSCEKEEFEPESKHTLTSANVDSIYYANKPFFDSLLNIKFDSIVKHTKTIHRADGGGFVVNVYSEEDKCFYDYVIKYSDNPEYNYVSYKYKIQIEENKLTETYIGKYYYKGNSYITDPENPSYTYLLYYN
ncbi:MAG TPA: hypothetical protein PK029_00130 [Bacteroidales bacterium]|nr:hypothetical protein [Bacteroidales bacterium]